MIVFDAAVAALLNDGAARRTVAGETIDAPHLIDAEVVSVLRRQVASRHITDAHARQGLDIWGQLGLLRYDAVPLLGRVWELRNAVTAYDALYVALAENLDCPLVTADARLAGASGPRCVMSVVRG